MYLMILGGLKSSVSNSRLDHHIARLSQFTREAQWRLELISSFDLSSNAGSGIFMWVLCLVVLYD